MRLFILFLWFCSLLVANVDAEKDDVEIKSLNLWMMCVGLDDHPHLQKKLQMSVFQIKKIEELISGNTFEDLFYEEERISKILGRKSRAEGNLDIYWELDAEIRKEVKKILTDTQIAELKRVSLAFRCPRGLSPFYDPEILAACGIILDHDFIKFLEQKGKEFGTEHTKITTEAMSFVLSELTASAKVLLAQIVGNRYMPGTFVSPDPVQEIGSVPFLDPSWSMNSNTLSDLTQGNSELSSQIGISQEQLLQLVKLERKVGHPPLKTYVNELTKILTKEQMVLIARRRNEAEMLHNFSWLFEQPRMIEFLGLDPKEADAMLFFAKNEDRKLREKYSELNRRMFFEACDKIPEPGRIKLQKLFQNVW